MDDTPTIRDNVELLNELWPKSNLSDPQKDAFRRAFIPLKQDRLNEAIHLAFRAHGGREPQLRWIDAQYSRLSESAQFTTEARYTGTMTWHVSYQRTSRHGVPGAWYGQRCQTREEAERIARDTGGRVTCMSKADDTEDYSDEALRADEIRARETLAGLSRTQITTMVDRLRSIGFVTEKLPARIAEWPRMPVLTVYAEYRNQQERRK